MLLILIFLFLGHHVSSEGTTHDCRNIDYRLTRLEVSTADKLSRLREDMKEGFTNQQNIVKALESISLTCVNNKVPDNTKVATCEIEDILKIINDRFKNLENLLSENQNTFKNVSLSGSHDITYPKNCAEVKNKTSNGVYTIKPGKNEISAFCDLTTDGGGWTVIQSRKSGDVDFYRGWDDYKKGFGNLQGDFWLGLENIYQLTNDGSNELLIELEDWDGVKKVAKYSSFGIGSEEDGYSLKNLGTFSGDAGDSFIYHAGQKFSTKERDQDLSQGSCAQGYKGGWWYRNCRFSNLNGLYLKGAFNSSKGITWHHFKGLTYSLKTSRMLIRPKK